ncbi:transglutaminase-like domain-containing protein [Mycobacterium sp. ITM-2016-00317]|uniref:transglutaminase-like domain-containing protein n=1 Tax=Mycobacterium sp. ITM-2016-00317 TaxID=2099694 RepID=UPI00287F6EB3|nr:transglutaminase-like domain-containing protein [Mycobacterium sp. ITM-2016-00317]WNG88145.1 transglutaminase-like domain-containing protein [Mycobacterium sp. ITM-2016-00317]
MSISCDTGTALLTKSGGPFRVTTRRIPSGARGTDWTLEQIRSFILDGAKDFTVRRRVVDILMAQRVRARDYLGEVKALFEWVQSNVRYTRDPHRVELLHSARRMLELRAGDCDDMTILLGAMLQSIGHPVRIVVVGPDPKRPNLFTHVYPEVQFRGRWIALDATVPHPMGWRPRAIVKKVISLRRRPVMSLHDFDDGLGQSYGAEDLIEAVRTSGLQPRDPRVKSAWDQLRSRGILARELWVRRLLVRLWRQGLPPGNRPRSAARLDVAIRSPGPSGYETPVAPAHYPGTTVYYPGTTGLYPRPAPYGWRPGQRPPPWRPRPLPWRPPRVVPGPPSTYYRPVVRRHR